MNQNRFRQIARLENAARPYIGMRDRIQYEWRMTRVGAAGHAAILAFLIRYGDPRVGEPLSCAWQRFMDTDVWKQHCDKWNELQIGRLGEEGKEYGESTPKDNRLAFDIEYGPSPPVQSQWRICIEHGTSPRVCWSVFRETMRRKN
jgi:hypothetical protein